MREASRFLAVILIMTAVKCLSTTASAEESLYDVRTARTVNGTTTTYYFGPKSANIRYDQRMIRASQIAASRARTHSTSRCWSAVKSALVDAHVVDSRPGTAYAKQAGDELLKFGFRKTSIKDPFAAPVGSVLVYGGRGAGHVELRTPKGFVSDFASATPSHRPLIGVYVKS